MMRPYDAPPEGMHVEPLTFSDGFFWGLLTGVLAGFVLVFLIWVL